MKTDIKTKIYSAQCIGNVEPIEYMTPYPSMRSLIEGQTIKFSDQIMDEISNITNQDFFDLVMQTSNWLQSIGICLLYTSPSPRDLSTSRMPSSA